MYFSVNFNVLFKLIKVHLLVSELYIYQNVRCNDKNYIRRTLVKWSHIKYTYFILEGDSVSKTDSYYQTRLTLFMVFLHLSIQGVYSCISSFFIFCHPFAPYIQGYS